MRDLKYGRVIIHARTDVRDPETETPRRVERVSMETPEAWTEYKNAGGCGKPASGYSLYCDNHELFHRTDDTAAPVVQFVDNRPQGRQRVILCAHRTAPKTSNNAPQIPEVKQNTNARTEKEITMSNTNFDLTAVQAQIAALNAALAAMTATPATTATAPANTAPANTAPANTAPANTAPANTAPAATTTNGGISTCTLTLGGDLAGVGVGVLKEFKADKVIGYVNHGYFASFKAVNTVTGERFQVTANIAAIKPDQVRDAIKAAKASK